MFNEALVWAYYDDTMNAHNQPQDIKHACTVNVQLQLDLVAWYFSHFIQGMDLIYQYQPHLYGITRRSHQGLDNRLLT